MRTITKLVLATLVGLAALLALSFPGANPREAGAACVPECNYSSWSCGSCGYGCVKTCTRQKCCLTMSCGYNCTTQTSTQSCSYTTCTSCTCSGLRECCDCYGNCVPSRCAPPAGCATPTPTPTPVGCLYGDCGYSGATYGVTCGDTPAEQTAGIGETCIQLINSNYCYCTRETDPTTYVCEPYRDPQVVDGVCYQQWECCRTVAGVEECFYQIRHDCVGGSATPAPTSTPAPTPSCSISLSPSSASVREGGRATFRASVVPTNGTVARVDFSAASSLASVAPLSDGTVPYDVSARGISAGTTGVVASAVMAGSVRCSAASTLTVSEPGPWWRVKDADVAANGSLVSLIPFGCALPACDPTFGLDGGGGFPGIPSYVGTINVGTSGGVSSTGWAAESAPGSRRNYSYSRFARQIPSDVEFAEIESGSVEGSLFESGGTLSRGAYWYRYDGSSGLDLSISSNANLGSRKVVLLVANADLYVGGKINLTDGEGFFAAIVGRDGDGNKGNVIVDPAVGGTADGVPELEGLFVADSEFGTGEGNSQLHVRGSVAGLSGILLQRDLDDDSQTPAEYFEYAPDLILNIPSSLRTSGYAWREVAP